MCSAISPVLQEPSETASETPIRIKKTFPRRVSNFIPCDKCFYLACSSWCSSSAGLSRVREAQGWPGPELSLSPTFWGSEEHPVAPSSQNLIRNQPPLGLSQGRGTGDEMHYLGQNSSAPGSELWLLKELNHQPSQTPETG